MKIKELIVTIVTLLMVFACQDNKEQSTETDAGVHKVVVREVLQANAYTYLKVQENTDEFWLAVTKRDAKEGETLYFEKSMEMKNFESRDLQKTFESVHFVESISEQPPSAGTANVETIQGQKPVITQADISVDPAEGGITIAALYAGRNEYAEKTVKIRGKVTKFNGNIMGRNWVHLQDGTDDAGDFDLTVTTNDQVKVGEVVTFMGKITLNRDFGAGYSYEVIMEQAELISEPKS